MERADGSRDYSQAVDVGTLAKGLDVGTIRILIWILGFMSFGYATAEFEVPSNTPIFGRYKGHADCRLLKKNSVSTGPKNISTILKIMRTTLTRVNTIVVSVDLLIDAN